jgi:hypothetical protein
MTRTATGRMIPRSVFRQTLNSGCFVEIFSESRPLTELDYDGRGNCALKRACPKDAAVPNLVMRIFVQKYLYDFAHIQHAAKKGVYTGVDGTANSDVLRKAIIDRTMQREANWELESETFLLINWLNSQSGACKSPLRGQNWGLRIQLYDKSFAKNWGKCRTIIHGVHPNVQPGAHFG